MLEVYTYNAGKGDCVRIRFGERHNIFIDSGVTRFAHTFKAILDNIKASGDSLDLLILTHVDDDHIGGILSLLRIGWICQFNEIRMNKAGADVNGSIPLSVRQNDEVYSLLDSQHFKLSPMLCGDVIELDGAVIKTISPIYVTADDKARDTPLAYHRDYGFSLRDLSEKPIAKSDHSVNNKNSIVFIFEYDNKCLLFTGDAWADDIITGIINKFGEEQKHFDFVKLPHHGSVANINEVFMNHIDCSDFLICTDGVMHPDKQTVAKLIKWYGKDINIYSPSNWWSDSFFTKDDDKSCVNLIHKEGLVIRW